ncbi:hypothetical protein [Ramlibacter sp. AN1133]|uniref:hypothetical protein n=1 Tax=Ramlibacter sp. AN1133 TaxID=3133429 RepID=UPI0030C5E69C
MNEQRHGLGERVLLMGVTAGGLATASFILDLHWLSSPWRYLLATLATLWK